MGKMQKIRVISQAVFLSVVGLMGASACGSGEVYQPVPFPEYIQYPDAAPPVTPAVAGAPVILAADQIDQLTAPIALYPDPLLAEMLPACTYPADVAAAWQFIQATPNPTEDAINAQAWDPTVKAMAHYPTVLQYMATNMDWTQALGAAFINQPQDVMDSIQALRADAQADQNLADNAQEQIVQDGSAIRIEPVNPEVIYVPVYDPAVVYVQPCPITYSQAFPIGMWCDNDFDWTDFYVVVGDGWYNRWHHPAEWDSHPPAWLHAGPPGTVHAGRWVHTPGKQPPRITRTAIKDLGLDHPHPVGPPGKNQGPNRPITRTQPPARVGDIPANPAAGRGNAFRPDAPRADVNQARDRGRQSQAPAVKAPSSPAPRENNPAPRGTVEAPRPVNPAPRPSAPNFVPPTPEPRLSIPVQRPAAPAPREAAPAPRISAPAPAERAPAPAVRIPAPEPAPRLSAPSFAAPPPRVIETPPPQAAPTFTGPSFSSPQPTFQAGGGQETRSDSERGHASMRR